MSEASSSGQETTSPSLLSSASAGYLAVLIAAAWWGTSGLFVKYIAGQAPVSPIALAFWRDLLTFLTLLIGVGLVRPSALRIRRDDVPRLAAMGATLGAFHVFWNLGVLLNGAAVVWQAASSQVVHAAAISARPFPSACRRCGSDPCRRQSRPNCRRASSSAGRRGPGTTFPSHSGTRSLRCPSTRSRPPARR